MDFIWPEVFFFFFNFALKKTNRRIYFSRAQREPGGGIAKEIQIINITVLMFQIIYSELLFPKFEHGK